MRQRTDTPGTTGKRRRSPVRPRTGAAPGTTGKHREAMGKKKAGARKNVRKRDEYAEVIPAKKKRGPPRDRAARRAPEPTDADREAELKRLRTFLKRRDVARSATDDGAAGDAARRGLEPGQAPGEGTGAAAGESEAAEPGADQGRGDRVPGLGERKPRHRGTPGIPCDC